MIRLRSLILLFPAIDMCRRLHRTPSWCLKSRKILSLMKPYRRSALGATGGAKRYVMLGHVGRIALGLVACAASASLLGWNVSPAHGQAPAKPAQQAKPSPVDICSGLTGADAAQKVIACTEAIKSESLVGGSLALAYLNRGLSESGAGSPARSKADFREAIRIFNDAINVAPTNPYLYIQRGVDRIIEDPNGFPEV